MMEREKGKIPSEKFSSITIFDNGIKLTAITGVVDPKNHIYKQANIYISEEDIKELLAVYGASYNSNSSSEYDEDYKDDDEDSIIDANY